MPGRSRFREALAPITVKLREARKQKTESFLPRPHPEPLSVSEQLRGWFGNVWFILSFAISSLFSYSIPPYGIEFFLAFLESKKKIDQWATLGWLRIMTARWPRRYALKIDTRNRRFLSHIAM